MWLQGAVYWRAKQHITVRHPDWNTGCSDVCDLLLKRITAISSHTNSFWGEVKETWQQQIGFTCAPNCIFKSKAFCGQNSVWGHCFLCSGLCFFPSRLFVYSFRCITPEKKGFYKCCMACTSQRHHKCTSIYVKRICPSSISAETVMDGPQSQRKRTVLWYSIWCKM